MDKQNKTNYFALFLLQKVTQIEFHMDKLVEMFVSSYLTISSVLFILQNAGGDPAVSSTVNPLITKRSKVKTEAEGPLPISPSSQVRNLKF